MKIAVLDKGTGYLRHVYFRAPANATVLQGGRNGEIVTSVDEPRGKGRLFASTQDCEVEMGVNQIKHLDPFLDSVVA